MAEINVTGADFAAKVLQSDIPVLVDFWATWCGPCRMIAPIVSALADEYGGKLKVCKVNVDEEGELAMQFGITGIPTLLFFKDGGIANNVIGFTQKDELEAIADSLI